MKTNDLIAALAADLPSRPTPVPRALATAIALSLLVMLAIFFGFIHLRPGFAGLLLDPKTQFKFVFTLSLLGSALWLALRVSRPGVKAGPARLALGGVFLLLAVVVGSEMAMRPASTWSTAMIGTYAVPCLELIGLLSIAPFAALMVALRTGAPDSPALAGAAAGLVAGSMAAAVYAMHCVEDSALFMAVWYVLAISAVTLIGAIVGRFALKW